MRGGKSFAGFNDFGQSLSVGENINIETAVCRQALGIAQDYMRSFILFKRIE